MADIKRYSVECYIQNEGDGYSWAEYDMYPCDGGEYVDYDDHKKIVDELKAKIQDLEDYPPSIGG